MSKHRAGRHSGVGSALKLTTDLHTNHRFDPPKIPCPLPSPNHAQLMPTARPHHAPAHFFRTGMHIKLNESTLFSYNYFTANESIYNLKEDQG